MTHFQIFDDTFKKIEGAKCCSCWVRKQNLIERLISIQWNESSSFIHQDIQQLDVRDALFQNQCF
jgi:hypothetical protein